MTDAPLGPRPSGRPPPPSMAFLLIALGDAVRAEVEDKLRARDLTLRHLSALGHLAGEPGLSYSELGRRAGVTAQSMQATLQQLEERGAVVRRSAPGRGRAAVLQVTERGTDLLAGGREVMAAADERILADVPARQHQLLSAALFTAFTGARRRHPRQ
jgi:DNA-binding MarR family transcriptional regulator